MANPNIVEDGKNTRFQIGNKVAETTTKEDIIEILKKMWDFLIEPADPSKTTGNIIRANSIKTIQEIYINFGMHSETWARIRKKYAEDQAVSGLIKRIYDILEARVLYSGSVMDIFLLKNRYGYADSHEFTGKNGAPLEGPRTAVINYAALSDDVVKALWDAQNLNTIEDVPEAPEQKQISNGSDET